MELIQSLLARLSINTLSNQTVVRKLFQSLLTSSHNQAQTCLRIQDTASTIDIGEQHLCRLCGHRCMERLQTCAELQTDLSVQRLCNRRPPKQHSPAARTADKAESVHKSLAMYQRQHGGPGHWS